MNDKYELSGKPGKIWLIGLPLGAVLGIILSIIYAYIMYYNPFIYINVFIFYGYLVGISMILAFAARLGKCRNAMASRSFGSLIGILMLYFNWATFVFVLSKDAGSYIPLIDILTSPSFVFDAMINIGKNGYYSLFDLDVRGFFLFLIWGIEAIAILFFSTNGGQQVLHEEVFCEDCGQWAADIERDIRISMDDKEVIDAAIAQNIGALADAPWAEYYPQLKVNLKQCSNCKQFQTVDVDKVTQERKKDKLEENKEDYSDVFVINNEDFDRFMGKQKPEPNKDAATETQLTDDNSGDDEIKPAGM